MPEAVDRAVPRGGDDPALRAWGQAGCRPPFERRGEGILDRLLGDVDVTEATGQDRNRAPIFATEYPLDLAGGDPRRVGAQSAASSCRGLTSTGRVVARASFEPHSSAASRSGALMIVNPPMCSFASVHGPSVKRSSPAPAFTTVAVLGGCSPAVNTHAPAAFISRFKTSRSCTILPRTSGVGTGPSGW